MPSLYANGMSFSVSSQITNQHDRGIEEDSENAVLKVVPGSSESMSGVSRYRDFISCLPGHLSKRILGKTTTNFQKLSKRINPSGFWGVCCRPTGLLDRLTLRRCQKVCQTWQHLARETLREVKLRKSFQELMKAMMRVSITIVMVLNDSTV